MRSLSLKATTIAALLLLPAYATAMAQDPRTVRVAFTAEELDNLVAPVALYPDPLLAQVLIASTFPNQVDLAAEFVRQRGTRDVDSQNWDLSVRSVAHYPPILNLLYEDPDWTTALGQAYASQSSDVMDAVQRLRDMAYAQGNLVSTDEQNVIVEREKIIIVPSNPRVIYVPAYDPGVVFFRPVVHLGFRTGFFSFGIGYPIGDWLVYDVDWYGRRIYYDGWYGGGWRTYARPYIVVRPIYVHPRYRVVHVGNVYGHVVNYYNIDRRYRRIHGRVSWERNGRDWRPNDRGPGRWNGTNRGPRDLDFFDGDGRRDDGRRGFENQRGDTRTPTLGTLRPDRGREEDGRKIQGSGTRELRVGRDGMGGFVKSPADQQQRQPVVRGGEVVSPRGPSEPRQSARPGQVERSTRANPPVIRSLPSKTAPQREASRSAPTVIRSKAATQRETIRATPPVIRSKVTPPREATGSSPQVIRSAPSRPAVQRQAPASSVWPTTRAQTTRPPKVSAPSAAKVKSAPARAGSASSGGKGKGKGGK
jgi:hypothetical protein